MVCLGIEAFPDKSITGLLSFPTTCFPQFYPIIMAAIFIILSFGLFMRDREREIKPDLISSMGVSAIAVIFLSLIGTLIGIMQPNSFIQIFVIGMVLIAIWMLKK